MQGFVVKFKEPISHPSTLIGADVQIIGTLHFLGHMDQAYVVRHKGVSLSSPAIAGLV